MTYVLRTRLPNGMSILCEGWRQAPVVALQAWVRVGAADEEPDEAGLAHLHEHMLFKGTQRRGVGALAHAVEAAGGEINAWTSFDQTVYHVVMEKHQAALGLDVLADALQNALFDPTELSREIEVVVEEIQRAKDSPSSRLSQALFSLAYQKHPYRLPILGTEQSVRAHSRDHILKFYKRHYRPDNVTLVAVGDLPPDVLAKKVEAAFGAWENPPAPYARKTRPQEPPPNGVRVHILREDVQETRLAIAHAGPAIGAPGLPAVDVLATLLGHGESSRLFDEVRRKLGVVHDISSYAYTPQDPGLFITSATLSFEQTGDALRAIVTTQKAVCEQAAESAELRKAKTLIGSDAAYARETAQGQARKLGFFEVSAGAYEFEQTYLQGVAALTPDDVQDIAQAQFARAPVLVVQVPQGAEPALREAELMARLAPQAPAAPRRAKTAGFAVRQRTLKNGTRLLLSPQPAPVLSLRAVALGGQRYESCAHSGWASLFSHNFGIATERLAPQALAMRTANLAGSVAGFCGRNSEGLCGDFVSEHGEAGLALFAECLQKPAFDAEHLAREKHVAVERIKSRADNPASVAMDLFNRALFPSHPYGMRLIGTPESLAKVDVAACQAHHQAFLRSDQQLVCVVGDFDVAQVEDVFAAAPAAREPQKLPSTPPADAPPDRVSPVKQALQRKQAHIIIGTRGLCLDDPQRFALEVVSTVLSGQSGRLFLDLRDQQSLAYALGSTNLEGLDPGYFAVHIGTSADKVEQAKAGVYAHLDKLLHEPPSAEELDRAQRYLIGTHAIGLQRGGARAMLMALDSLYGLPFDDYTRYAERIQKVSRDDVLQVCQSLLPRHRLVEVVVGPA